MGSTALITGGASGLGYHLSRRFLDDGWSVLVHYHSASRGAEELGDRENARTTRADLRDPGACRELADRVADQNPELELLVNNAALFRETPLDGPVDRADWDDQMNLNARAPYLLSRRLRDVLAQNEGCVINLLDAALARPYANRIPYFASKGALETLTRNMARAFAPQIRVNAVSPGPIDFPDYYEPERIRRVLQDTLLKRRGEASEVADAVEFLARDATYTTGVVLEVDGGQHLG